MSRRAEQYFWRDFVGKDAYLWLTPGRRGTDPRYPGFPGPVERSPWTGCSRRDPPIRPSRPPPVLVRTTIASPRSGSRTTRLWKPGLLPQCHQVVGSTERSIPIPAPQAIPRPTSICGSKSMSRALRSIRCGRSSSRAKRARSSTLVRRLDARRTRLDRDSMGTMIREPRASSTTTRAIHWSAIRPMTRRPVRRRQVRRLSHTQPTPTSRSASAPSSSTDPRAVPVSSAKTRST